MEESLFDTRPRPIPLVVREREGGRDRAFNYTSEKARAFVGITEIKIRPVLIRPRAKEAKNLCASRVSRGFPCYALKSSTLYKDTN